MKEFVNEVPSEFTFPKAAIPTPPSIGSQASPLAANGKHETPNEA